MSEHFLKFKKAFHKSMPQMPQMKFPTFPKPMFDKLNDLGGIQHSKWIQLFSSGIIIYSAYFYLKRTPKYNEARLSFFSFFYQFKKLFTRSIANRCREKETQKNVSLEVKELPEHVKYDNGWFDELDELKILFTSTSASTLGDDALLDPLRETTPRGEIVMYYDADTKSFNYYSNSKNIPYSTLDAVARKYVCLHKDPSIYIDIRDEVKKGREKLLKKNKDNKLKLERNKDNNNGMISSVKKSLFAAFKNYKTGRNAARSIHNYDGKVTVEEFVVIKDNINKFIYKGTIEQYDVDVKYYNNKQQSNFLKGGTIHDHVDHDKSADADNVLNDDDYFKLNHEKEALSYTDFKKNIISKK